LRSFEGNKGPVQGIVPSGKASEDSPKTHDGSALVDFSTSCKDEIPRAIIKIGQIPSNHFELHLSCQRYHREREHTQHNDHVKFSLVPVFIVFSSSLQLIINLILGYLNPDQLAGI